MDDTETSPAGGWFGVRCLFAFPEDGEGPTDTLYEERVTLWRADDFVGAVGRAEAEAEAYAATVGGVFLGLSQAYHLAEAPADGAEVFSLTRDSTLPPGAYLDASFDTGRERQGELPA